MATQSHIYLSALAFGSKVVVPMVIFRGGTGPDDRTLAHAPQIPRPLGRLADFRRHVIPRARLSKCLSLPLFVRRRPLSIPGKPGTDHALRSRRYPGHRRATAIGKSDRPFARCVASSHT